MNNIKHELIQSTILRLSIKTNKYSKKNDFVYTCMFRIQTIHTLNGLLVLDQLIKKIIVDQHSHGIPIYKDIWDLERQNRHII
jgi:hypothetical protein